jgi:phenylalanine-4-hydroxylase
MYEEGQLYSPVTQGEGGQVTVHLADDHPGANDPEYRERRNEIAAAALAWEPGEPAPAVQYTEAEQEVWRTVCRELRPKHERLAIREFNEGVTRLALPTDQVPSLDEVSANLEPLTGFRYVPAAGLVPLLEFYGSCAIQPYRSTPRSPTSSTRSSGTGTCSRRRRSPSSTGWPESRSSDSGEARVIPF